MTGQNLHTHSTYSDGKATPDAVIEAALAQGMHCLGFSDHAPVPFDNSFSIRPGELEKYCTSISDLKQKFRERLSIHLALEIDYIPGLMEGFDAMFRHCDLAYRIGSVHLVGKNDPEKLWFIDGPLVETYDEGLKRFFDNDIRRAVTAFYAQTNQMVEKETFDVIGHFDKIKMHNQQRFFREDEAWYRTLVCETLQLIKQKDLIVEVNTRGLYKKRSDSFFPSVWIIAEMKRLDIPVLISSDAHQPAELQLLFPEAIAAVKLAGYRAVMQFSDSGWSEINL